MRQKNHHKPLNIFNFFAKYWVTTTLLIALSTLFYQNFVVNQFPNSLKQKQQIIAKSISTNQVLAQQNQQLISAFKISTDAEILESQARYRFGMVKADEIYYRIQQ